MTTKETGLNDVHLEDDDATMDTKDSKVALRDMPRDVLKPTNIYGYGVGHFLNDLCASAWFTYTLYFVESVVKPTLDNSTVGLVMLSG